MALDLKEKYGISVPKVYHNPSVARLYELAMQEPGNFIASSGALVAYSGDKRGRSPKNKRVVRESESEHDIWWGNVNIEFPEHSFELLKDQAVRGLSAMTDHVYVVDGYAGWQEDIKIKVRVLCARAYHALFMRTMLMRPTEEQLAEFGEPDWVIYNCGHMQAMNSIPGVEGGTCPALNFKTREMVILGTEYAGEMKKGIFTVLNYELPKKGILSMHCSANEGDKGDTALFFGLSGTGKTTLSADPHRHLIGDDEHGWSDEGIFNFEGGCYAKVINLSKEKEPQIYSAIRFGSVLENVVMDERNQRVNWKDASITENTRVAYPVEYIPNAKIPCVGPHPKNIIFLTCDAFGVLPPVSRLSSGQAMYHFISGYTAKVAGTEEGVKDPEATFSACFGAAFLAWHPTKYAQLLKKKLEQHDARVWLVNTGWTGGASGVGTRFDLVYTRAIIDAILNGDLNAVDYETDEIFGLSYPSSCPHVPTKVLCPRNTWVDQDGYDATAGRLAEMFHKNFEKYADLASDEILAGGPRVGANA